MKTLSLLSRLAILLLVIVPATIVRAQDLSGAYANEKLSLVIAAAPANTNNYAGTITLGGVRMPARGTLDRAKDFAGTFEANGQTYPFTLTPGPDGLTLASGGMTYQLRKAGGGGGGGNNPGPAANGLPAFLKPGTRITYHAGDSVVQGVGSHLVEDPNGNWGDPKTGKTYSDQQLRNSGGVGYHEVSIVQATPELVAADIRNYPIIDVQRGIASSGGVAAALGNGQKLGDYWIHPAALAAMPEMFEQGRKVNRIDYPLNGRTFKAISIADSSATSYSRVVYDLEGGLLLSRATSTAGANVKSLDPATGKVTPGQGAAVISHMILVAVRDVKIPWANEPVPQWATRGRRLDYQGGYALQAGPGLPPLPPLGMQMAFAFEDAQGGIVTAKQLTRSDIGQGLPAQESTADRCFGSAMINGAWIGPTVIRQLAPNTVIDEDPVTKFRTTFTGVQGNVAVFAVQGPVDSSQLAYDVQSGMLVGLDSSRKGANGQTNTQLRLAGNR